ncbi:DNA repair exonuclease [Corallococcus sp. CA047B]|uniref:metallophosphoesterase family protein n=1 Tax=Corallococcus sp. CA047B TaxID=2316729 RepID=UPI000EA2C23C|nr:DNA repair exonuclease [Corallococcus sp. CA047B]RKH02658.1 DNA repair exonuclease [Corallococcus sp. CA047B]
MRFSFVHAADLHLDTPFRGVATHGPLLERFQQSTFLALARIVDVCLRERVTFLLLAGDLFDVKDRSVRARLALRSELARLDRAGIQTFIVHGNHDPLSGDTGTLGLPASVKVFGPEWEDVEVRREGRRLCHVQGVSYPDVEVRENLSARFRRTGTHFSVGLLHANLGGDAGHANYAPCTAADLAAGGLDYWALGHVHTRAEHLLPGGGVAVYPGNPQGRHIHETGERGCVVVDVEDGVARRRFVPVDRVRWHRLDVPLFGVGSLDALQAVATEVVEARCAEDFDGHAVRLTLAGRGPLHRELSRPGARAQLEADLRERLSRAHPPVLLESLRDGSRPEVDLEAVRAGGGFMGTLLEEARALEQDDAALAALWDDEELTTLGQRLKRLGVDALEAPRPELVAQAGQRGVEQLHEETS